MSQGVNSVELIGFLRELPEVKHTTVGVRAELKVVTREVWNSGEREIVHPVVCFERTAELCADLQVGDTVMVVGQNRTAVALDPMGNRHKRDEVFAFSVTKMAEGPTLVTVNRILLVGNLGAKPECKYVPNIQEKVSITTLRLATTQSWYDAVNDDFNEDTQWHRAVVFGDIGRWYAEIFNAGALVYFEGRNRVVNYFDAARIEHRRIEVIVDNMRLLNNSPTSGGKYLAPQLFSVAKDRAAALEAQHAFGPEAMT